MLQQFSVNSGIEMKMIKENIVTEIIQGNWWDLKAFFNKLLQLEFLQSLMKTTKTESTGEFKKSFLMVA